MRHKIRESHEPIVPFHVATPRYMMGGKRINIFCSSSKGGGGRHRSSEKKRRRSGRSFSTNLKQLTVTFNGRQLPSQLYDLDSSMGCLRQACLASPSLSPYSSVKRLQQSASTAAPVIAMRGSQTSSDLTSSGLKPTSSVKKSDIAWNHRYIDIKTVTNNK